MGRDEPWTQGLLTLNETKSLFSLIICLRADVDQTSQQLHARYRHAHTA